MSELKSQILPICEEIVREEGFFIIELIVRGSVHKRVIELFIDGKESVSTETCKNISRKVEEQLDQLDKLKSYRFDVSSPGVDRPLIYLEQYPKHIGRKFKIEYKTDDEKKSFEGKLIKIDDDFLVLNGKKEEIKIKFDNIIKAHVLLSF